MTGVNVDATIESSAEEAPMAPSHKGRLPVRRRRREITDFGVVASALSAVGESFLSFEDIEDFLVAEAETAGSYPSSVATLSYVLGFENVDTTNEQIQETVVTIIQKMHDPTISEENLSGAVPDFAVWIIFYHITVFIFKGTKQQWALWRRSIHSLSW